MSFDLDSTKTGARPSHEAVESTGGNATDLGKTPLEHVDHIAMDSAKRAQNRIHADEGVTPGSQIFTK